MGREEGFYENQRDSWKDGVYLWLWSELK